MTDSSRPVLWHRSFYVRLAGSIVLFSVSLLLLQTLLFSRLRARTAFPARDPNTTVAMVAADLQGALARDPALDLDAYLKREYGTAQPIYIVRRPGTVAANRTEPLAADLRAHIETLLRGGPDPPVAPRVPMPFVSAPVQVADRLDGIVVLPPNAAVGGPGDGIVERLASPAGTALFIVLTVVAAAFIFEPARRRLRALEAASRRLGAGDLTARAPVSGGDEVSAVAAAFNHMAVELERRDEALRTSDRLRRQMIADVSHELRTPLTSMRGYLETLRNEALSLDATRRAQYFATLERETVRLERLVQDLLELSRLEHGVTTFEHRLFATQRLLEHVRNRHQPEIEQRRMDLAVEVSAEADQMHGDPDRLEQVIENLFANALRHTPDGGRLSLSAGVDDHHIVLTVTDSGAGIPPEHLPHVFDRFYKADPARARQADGSGLGLSIARAIVERHGGELAVTSVPGRTTFSVRLPHESGDRLNPRR